MYILSLQGDGCQWGSVIRKSIFGDFYQLKHRFLQILLPMFVTSIIIKEKIPDIMGKNVQLTIFYKCRKCAASAYKPAVVFN